MSRSISGPRQRNNLMERRDHWCHDERLLDRPVPRPPFPSGPHLCECHGRYRNPAGPLLSLPCAQCPVPSARCPVRSVSRRGSVRSQVPSHALPGAPITTALSSAPGDRPAFQREKCLGRNIPSGESWPCTLAGLLPSTSRDSAPSPPSNSSLSSPRARSSLPRTHAVAAWPGCRSFVFTSHTCLVLASSFPPPPPPPPRPPPHPRHPLRLTTSSL